MTRCPSTKSGDGKPGAGVGVGFGMAGVAGALGAVGEGCDETESGGAVPEGVGAADGAEGLPGKLDGLGGMGVDGAGGRVPVT